VKHLDAAATSETSAATDLSHDAGDVVEPQEAVDPGDPDEGAARSDVDDGDDAETEPTAGSSTEQVRVSSIRAADMADVRSATEGRVTHGRLTRWLVTAERLTPRQVFWLAFGALFVLMSARGVPAILIPYPYAAENHQEKNARAMEAAGAAEVILNRDLDGAVLTEALRTLLSDDVRRAGMAAAMKRLGKPKAAEEIAALALRISKGEG